MVEWVAIVLGASGWLGAWLAWRRQPAEIRNIDVDSESKLVAGADQMVDAASSIILHYQSIISELTDKVAVLSARVELLEKRATKDEDTIHKLRNRIMRLEAFLYREGYNPQEIV